jgi:hypothetical protein
VSGRATPVKGGDKETASDAATWIQVVLAGAGVTIALVAAVFGYFAWVQPHEPKQVAPAPVTTTAVTTITTAATGAATTATVAGGKRVALGQVAASAGVTNVRAVGGDLVMACPNGQSNDQARTVEYDLRGLYTGLEAQLRVSKAPDDDSAVQVKVFSDGREAANKTLTRTATGALDVRFSGTGKMRIQVVCQSPDSEITFGNPTLIHS